MLSKNLVFVLSAFSLHNVIETFQILHYDGNGIRNIVLKITRGQRNEKK